MTILLKKLVTHNATFHLDDIFACATLSMLLESKGEKFEIIRTRDEDIIKHGDYVFDIGGSYDSEKNRFDHHQHGGAGERTNHIPYSSFGLVWKKFGKELCGVEEISERIDKKLVQSIDAGDNGVDLYKLTTDVQPYGLHSLFYAFRPSWNEEDNFDLIFLEMVELAKKILSREIVKEKNTLLGEKKFIEIYEKTEDKRLIITEDRYPWAKVCLLHPEILFVVNHRLDGTWSVNAVNKKLDSFENRKNLPALWAGLSDEELQKITGVLDAIFCHRGLFLAVAKSKDGAVKLAELALSL